MRAIAFNGAGSFVRTDGVRSGADVHAQQKTAGVKIRADLTDTELEDIATGMELAVLRDGQNAAAANLPMGGFKHTGVTTSSGGSSRSEYTSGGVVQDGAILDAGSTGGTSTAFTATLSPAITAYADKQLFRVKFNAAFGATPTINFNSVAAKKMYWITKAGSVTQLTTNDVPSGYPGLLRYDTSLDSSAGGFMLLNPPAALIASAANTWSAAQTFSAAVTMSGAAINEAKGADIASATTTDIGAATGNYVVVTGTTTITGLGTVQAGTRRVVEFSGALTLTHNATSLILPGGANITTAAGDCATFVSEGSGNWRCVSYVAATGMPVVASRQVGSPTGGDKGAGTINVDGSSSLFGIYQDGNPTGLKLISTLTASTSATLDFTATNSTIYSAYRFIIEDYLAATDATDLHMRVSTDGGSSYQAGTGYSYGFIGATSAPATGNAGGTGASAAKMLNSLSNVAGTSGVIDVIIGGRTRMVGVLHGYQSAGVFVSVATGGEWNSSGVNAIRFLQSSGNITSGTIRVYGIPKA